MQRFEDAEVLRDHGRTTGAIYLGGYAVECMLKALLLANVPASRHASLMQSFRGRMGHDLDELKKELARRNVHLPLQVTRDFIRVRTWSTRWRYHPGKIKLREAEAFLSAVVTIIQWAKGRF